VRVELGQTLGPYTLGRP